MKKIIYNAIFILGSMALLCLASCLRKPTQKQIQSTHYSPHEIIFYLDDAADATYLASLESYLESPTGASPITIEKCKCDQNLVKITQTGIANNILNGEDGPPIRPYAGGHSDGGPLFANMPDNLQNSILSVDVNIEFTPIREYTGKDYYENKPQVAIMPLPFLSSTRDKKIIAVIDAGLTFTADLDKNYIWKNETERSGGSNNIDDDGNNMVDDIYGWNFVNDSNDIIDTVNPHGNNVASFLAYELKANQDFNAKIMNLKVLDSSNKGNLFDVMCALLYAYQNNADVINLSLGYYGRESKMLKTVLEAKNFSSKVNINEKFKNKIIVTAAGNSDQQADLLESSTINCRNLEEREVKFYPAYFARKPHKLKNLMVATTIDKNTMKVAENQNYSNKLIDGVWADVDYLFKDTNLMHHNGSSYAAPILSSRVVNHITNYHPFIFKNCKKLRSQMVMQGRMQKEPSLASTLLRGHNIKRQ